MWYKKFFLFTIWKLIFLICLITKLFILYFNIFWGRKKVLKSQFFQKCTKKSKRVIKETIKTLVKGQKTVWCPTILNWQKLERQTIQKRQKTSGRQTYYNLLYGLAARGRQSWHKQFWTSLIINKPLICDTFYRLL